MRIGIDVDDVVLDLHSEWSWLLRQKYGVVECHADDWESYNFWEKYGLSQEDAYSVLTPGIYANVDAYPDAAGVLDAIEAMGHEVVFVTSCHEPNAYEAKVMRLDDLGLMKNRQLVPCGPWAEHISKATVPVQWLVDDHIANVEAFPGHALLVTRPHNARLACTRKRIKKLQEVVEELRWVKAPERNPLLDRQVDTTMQYEPFQTADKSHIPQAKDQTPVAMLPTDKQERKDTPIMSGCLDYFSAAIAEVARVSLAGNKQHFVNEPLHWQRGLSSDHADAAVRHLMERGTIDTDGVRHSAKAAWRALALLQEELEAAGAPMSRASRPAA